MRGPLLALLLAICLIVTLPAAAQSPDEDLTIDDAAISLRTDAFGVEEQVISGHITNNGDTAYTGVTIFADLASNDGEIIGEAFGYIVTACGDALLDSPIQPDETRRYALSVDQFGDGVIDDYEFFFTAEATEPEPLTPLSEFTGVTQISSDEIVVVEWLDENSLRYGAGCYGDLFTEHEWYEYNVDADESTAIDEHPDAGILTDTFLELTQITTVTQTQQEDPSLLNDAMITLPTVSDRVVFQNDLNTIFTGNRDGSFVRLTATNLYQYTLQGFVFSPSANFLAYYFGGYGEGVRYFTARMNGGRISTAMQNLPTSTIVPGITDDGLTAITGSTYTDENGDEVTGYWWTSTVTGNHQLLFEGDVPGNNYPAPAYYRKDNATRFIYLVRDVDDETVLQCFHREANELHTLTPLPLQIDTDERAWTWLSPERNYLALAANGEHGGLWLIDLNAFEVCR